LHCALPLDPQAALASLQRLCRRIVRIGESLQVIKAGEVRDGLARPVPPARNEKADVGTRKLLLHAMRGKASA
jgi:hypothetical protein